MTDAPRPTRAEATDVANLVLDGADGIVLGSETFRGKFPVAAAETVLAISRQAEHSYDSYKCARRRLGGVVGVWSWGLRGLGFGDLGGWSYAEEGAGW